MQGYTSNYRHLCSHVKSSMPGGNKRSYILKAPDLLSNIYDHLLLPGIKGFKIDLCRP